MPIIHVLVILSKALPIFIVVSNEGTHIGSGFLKIVMKEIL